MISELRCFIIRCQAVYFLPVLRIKFGTISHFITSAKHPANIILDRLIALPLFKAKYVNHVIFLLFSPSHI
jgi:hypothetical protein